MSWISVSNFSQSYFKKSDSYTLRLFIKTNVGTDAHFVFPVKDKDGHKCLEEKLLHRASYCQSIDSNQPTRRAPSVPDGPGLSFSCWGNIRWQCCATWKPSKEMLSKTREVSKVAMQHENTKAPAYMLPLINHILFRNTLNQITYPMKRMWFHSKSNILISQIQYQRQYQPILEVNRWSVTNMSINWVKNSCYWFGWCDWQWAVETWWTIVKWRLSHLREKGISLWSDRGDF